jgi:glycosyltransferase involved in cell wall biosynthesis
VPATIIVSANIAWNLVNFRAGVIRALVDAGFDVVAAAPSDAVAEAQLRALGCAFAAVPVDAKGLSPRRDLATTLAYVRLLRRQRPVAFLGWTIKPNIYGALAARLTRVPAILNVSGLGTAFIRQNLLTRIVKLLYRLAFARAAVVFFQNDEDFGTFVVARLVTARQARRLPGSGVDVAHFRPRSDARPVPGHFLMIARLLGDKGVREYVAAARIVRRAHPHTRFTLLGFLDVANRTAISREEVERWVSEGVIDYQPPLADVRPAIAAADIVVLPSYREGMSRVLLEAAAMARPIVTSDVPGCRDIVTDGVNGFLCAPRDADALAAAMMRAATLDDAAWRDMGRAGRRRVMDEFSEARVIALYLAALADAGVSPGR